MRCPRQAPGSGPGQPVWGQSQTGINAHMDELFLHLSHRQLDALLEEQGWPRLPQRLTMRPGTVLNLGLETLVKGNAGPQAGRP